jgi:hypothetical protein
MTGVFTDSRKSTSKLDIMHWDETVDLWEKKPQGVPCKPTLDLRYPATRLKKKRKKPVCPWTHEFGDTKYRAVSFSAMCHHPFSASIFCNVTERQARRTSIYTRIRKYGESSEAVSSG